MKRRRKKLTDAQADEFFIGMLCESVAQGDRNAESILTSMVPHEESSHVIAYAKYVVRGPLALLPWVASILCVLCVLCVSPARAMDRLAALSMLESGNNDNAVGRSGEISRFQIMPDIFAKYFFVIKPAPPVAAIRLRLASRNAFTASNIAHSIMRDRCNAFSARYHRPASDFEFYILWARPAWLLSRSHSLTISRSFCARAQRFSNLCQR